MSTLQTDEANIIDAEEVKWQWIVLPLVLVLLVAAGGFGVYYYLQMQQDAAEAEARTALLKATTPAEFLKVAEQYPKTDQAMLATFSAANASFDQRDYDGAQTAYRKIIDNPALSVQWRDSASIGIASCDEAKGDADKAINEYLEVARRGDASPFAAYAYNCVARIYDARGDKKTEGEILQQAAELNPDSPSARMAQERSKELTPQTQPMSFPVANPNAPAPNPAPPAPTPAAK
jgi:tetratricopeptide (TPR) repeat protein